MTDLIADLRQKLAAAGGWSPLPWTLAGDDVVDEIGCALVDLTVDTIRRSSVCWSPDSALLVTTAVNALPCLLDEITVSRLLIDHLTQPSPDGWTSKAIEDWHTRRKALLDAHELARAANEGSPS